MDGKIYSEIHYQNTEEADDCPNESRKHRNKEK